MTKRDVLVWAGVVVMATVVWPLYLEADGAHEAVTTLLLIEAAVATAIVAIGGAYLLGARRRGPALADERPPVPVCATCNLLQRRLARLEADLALYDAGLERAAVRIDELQAAALTLVEHAEERRTAA